MLSIKVNVGIDIIDKNAIPKIEYSGRYNPKIIINRLTIMKGIPIKIAIKCLFTPFTFLVNQSGVEIAKDIIAEEKISLKRA
ncbi:MAG: hypothetical protein AABX94_00315 [Nanoarchaeota archaeon]